MACFATMISSRCSRMWLDLLWASIYRFYYDLAVRLGVKPRSPIDVMACFATIFSSRCLWVWLDLFWASVCVFSSGRRTVMASNRGLPQIRRHVLPLVTRSPVDMMACLCSGFSTGQAVGQGVKPRSPIRMYDSMFYLSLLGNGRREGGVRGGS